MSTIWEVRRSTSDVKVAGLCGGLARHWGIDPVLVRVGWALLALSGGIGVILYVAGWLLVPADGRDTAPAQDMFGDTLRKWPREVWVAIVVIACVAGFAVFGGIAPFGIGPAVVVALVWYFGFYRKRAAAPTSPAPPAALPPPVAPFRYPGPPTPFTEAAEAWQRRIAEYQAGPSANVPPAPPWSAPPPGNLAPPPVPVSAYAAPPVEPVPVADPEQLQREAFLATPDPVGLYVEPTGSSVPAPLIRPGQRPSARRLRWATLLALGLTMGGLGLADNLGADITPTVYAAATLLVVGLALVLATWLGRARGLLPVGALLAVGVLGLGVAGSGIPALATPPGSPGTTIAYTRPADFPADGDHKDVGTLRVDLSGLTLTEDATYQAGVDLGSIVVIVPPGANVVLNYRTDAGSVTAFGRRAVSGTELDDTFSDPQPMAPTKPTLTLDVGVDVGSIEVRR